MRSAPSKRARPVRDRILAFMTEPRRAVEIARHMERSVPNITGQLRAMQRLQLVVRLGYGVYAPAVEPYLPAQGSVPTPRRGSLEMIPEFLGEPRTLSDIAARFGITKETAQQHLRALLRRGIVSATHDGRYSSG